MLCILKPGSTWWSKVQLLIMGKYNVCDLKHTRAGKVNNLQTNGRSLTIFITQVKITQAVLRAE